MQNRKFTNIKWFDSPYLSRVFLVVGIVLAVLIFTAKCFAHVHIEIDVPHGTWEAFEKHDQKEAYEKSQTQEGRDDMSSKEKSDAYIYEREHTA